MSKSDLHTYFTGKQAASYRSKVRLGSGSRVAIMGGGPAGSFFGCFLLDLAERAGLDLEVDIYEPRDFSKAGPRGCNMCAGIVSETLIQNLAMDGIYLPPEVIQRSMDSYVLHNDAGQVRLKTPDLERRIATTFRGLGPKQGGNGDWLSFDGFLLGQAIARGANLVQKRVDGIDRADERIRLTVRGQAAQEYEFVAVATGVNTNALRLFEKLEGEYRPPRMAQTFIREYYLGEGAIERHFGQSIHFFLLDIPGLDFAAMVPKNNYVTICLLGQDISQEHFDIFLNSPQVRACMPDDWQAGQISCHCSPRINVSGAYHPFAERMIFLGDIGVSRLYKDGIGAAYRAAKVAATAAVFGGVSEADLAYSYGRVSRAMERDNAVGRGIFTMVDFLKPRRSFAQALLEAAKTEQARPNERRPMSGILWDLYTGSAPYQDVLVRLLHPKVWIRFLGHLGVAWIRSA